MSGKEEGKKKEEISAQLGNYHKYIQRRKKNYKVIPEVNELN
jgi:hypothetical protein